MQRVVGGCYNEFVILYKDQKIAFVYVHVVGYVCTRTRMYVQVVYLYKYISIKTYLFFGALLVIAKACKKCKNKMDKMDFCRSYRF